MQGSRGGRISELARAWSVLGFEQRAAAVGALLLIVSTFGRFSWVEGAEIITGLGILLLLKRRADGYQFHLPFGDGTAITVAGAWAIFLILVRLFDRPLGQNLLALACGALIVITGLRERAKRPMDDVPEKTLRIPRDADVTDLIPSDVLATEPLPPRAGRRRGREAPKQ
jgi:hypothetical protein